LLTTVPYMTLLNVEIWTWKFEFDKVLVPLAKMVHRSLRNSIP
jgi:hypothetical protein